MVFDIDKNIPLPISIGNTYPFDKMEIGDSFLIKAETKSEAVKKRAKVISSAKYYKDKNGKSAFKLKTKHVDEGIRIWRVS